MSAVPNDLAVIETWKSVHGWEGWYEVSDHGRVRRVRPGRGGNTHVGRVLKGALNKRTGYVSVALHRDPEIREFLVHRLVLTAFSRLPVTGEEANHKNSDRTDNHLCNLEWVTHKENQQHASIYGRMVRGSAHHNCKLTDADVAEIRRRYRRRNGVGDLAAEFGITPAHLWKVANRRVR